MFLFEFESRFVILGMSVFSYALAQTQTEKGGCFNKADASLLSCIGANCKDKSCPHDTLKSCLTDHQSSTAGCYVNPCQKKCTDAYNTCVLDADKECKGDESCRDERMASCSLERGGCLGNCKKNK